MGTKSALPRRLAAAALSLVVGSVLAVGVSSVAHAKGEYRYWNSPSHPLFVRGYGSQAKGYGNWRVANTERGTKSLLAANVWLYSPNNHKRYARFETWVNAGYCIQPKYLSCNARYYRHRSAHTPHSNFRNGQWQWLFANTSVSPSADYARARVWVCLDIPWRFDPCAGPTYTLGTAY